MYSARISRTTPAAFILLIDQSGSMEEQTLFSNQLMSKAEAVSFVVNMLITELLNRCRKEDGYRDYFDLAVLGYYETRVEPLIKKGNSLFVPSSKLAQMIQSKKRIQKERQLPTGRIILSEVEQPQWIAPRANGKTPMYSALCRCFQLVSSWCSDPDHRACYPPTIFNITDGEFSDGDDERISQIAQDIRSLSTEDGEVLLVNMHITANQTVGPVLFPASQSELPVDPYAHFLYSISSTMPSLYNEQIELIRNKKGCGNSFRGMSYNAGLTDLIGLMNVGSVSVNLLY